MTKPFWNFTRRARPAGFAAAGLLAFTAAQAADLPVWDDYTYDAQAAVMKTLVQKFEAAHPDTKVTLTSRSFDDLGLTLKLAIKSGDGPVVTKVNQGAKDMGAMALDGQLLPVDDDVAKYGWDKEQSKSLMDRDRWTKDGKFGSGDTYGISSLGELVGLYYNEAVLKKAGVALPLKTFADFEAALAKVKAAGITPIAIGTSKGHMALHLWAALAQAQIGSADRAQLDDLVYGRGGTWNTDGNIKAATLEQDWADKGYFLDGYQGISGDDAAQLFIGGQAAFVVSGTWYLGDMQMNPDIHFTTVPAPDGVAHPLTVGGVDLAWAVTALAKDPASKALAGEFINAMVSPEAATEWARAGYLPATSVSDEDDLKLSPVLKEALDVWKDLNAHDAVGHYPDWASPTMLKTMDDNLPLLLADREKPAEFVGKLEDDYKAYLAGKN